MKSLDVKLNTVDDFEIAGTYIPGSLPFGVVLVHMMPATKESYAKFVEQLSRAGFHTLAIDLRGHGESSGGDYQNFSAEQHQKSIFDLKASVDYLLKQNPDMGIGFVGASIGANLSMQYAAANPAAFAIFLSPGLNYYGIEAGRLTTSLPEVLPVYFVSALDDDRVEGNAAQTETLYNACSSQKKSIQIFRTGGHGTQIFDNNPEFMASLVEWVKEATQNLT